MNLTSPLAIKEILTAYGIRPRQGLGQHFLTDPRPIAKLLATANIQPTDTIVEIGPGIGVLTQKLATRAKHVIAIEKDEQLVRVLKGLLAEMNNVEIIHGDALQFETTHRIQNTKYKVVANLPYYITAPTIRMFLETTHAPESITLIIQKEVAQRICAKPPRMSILAVSVQFYAATTIAGSVKRSSFWPQPRVDSAIIHIVPRKEKPAVSPRAFFQVVKAGFLHPRRQIVNNIATGLHTDKKTAGNLLEQCGIQPARRAETLSVQDWINLAGTV